MIAVLVLLLYNDSVLNVIKGSIKMKYMRGLLVAIISTFIIGNVVGAQSGCDAEIGETGPGSNNEVICEENTNITVVCQNGIYVVVDNDQDSESGNANNSGNTTGGNATSGNATNENGQTVEIGSSCAAASPVTPPPAPTPTPTPGSGSGQVLSSSSVAVLPNTSNTPVTTSLLVGAAAIGILYGIVRLAAYAYGRIH